jgi:phosphoribosylformylglycinamidine synthase
MAASAIDEAIRNCVAVGADPDRIAILDNFCWGNTDRPEELGRLVRAALACRDIATAYGTPFISGKDSLNNEFKLPAESGGRRAEGPISNLKSQISGGDRIVIPATLLISAVGQIDDVRKCVTMDLKEPGNTLVLIGETKDELGGSHYELASASLDRQVPTVDVRISQEIFRRLHRAILNGLVRSCHDLSEGGLAVALAEMAIAGGVGAEVELHTHLWPATADSPRESENLPAHVLLFAESNSRFIVEVEPKKFRDFFALMGQQVSTNTGHQVVRLSQIGRVIAEPVLRVKHGQVKWRSQQPSRGDTVSSSIAIDESTANLKECWQRPLRW